MCRHSLFYAHILCPALTPAKLLTLVQHKQHITCSGTVIMSLSGLTPRLFYQLLFNIIHTTVHLSWRLSAFARWLFLALKLSIKASLSTAFHASYLDIMSSFTGDPRHRNALSGVSFGSSRSQLSLFNQIVFSSLTPRMLKPEFSNPKTFMSLIPKTHLIFISIIGVQK